MNIKLLLSPLCKGAYFADYLKVAQVELLALFPDKNIESEQQASLHFLNIEATSEELKQLSRLSFTQGIFEEMDGKLRILAANPGFHLPEELVYGCKYRGKTNELVTQLAINLGLCFAEIGGNVVPQLLDPLAGRGTTLLWALRYDMDSTGIELDGKSLDAFQLHVKKQCKLHRIKHKSCKGQMGKRNKKERGKFREFHFDEHSVKLITGDSRDIKELVQNKRFHLLVTDLPYGVQHVLAKGTRNPLQTLTDCAGNWIDCLRPGGTLTLIFNAYQPKRDDLVQIFTKGGLELQDFSAPHRMSEAILRDILIFKKRKE